MADRSLLPAVGRVDVAAGREAGLALEEIPGARISAAQHGPTGGDAVKGQERKSQAVRVLGAVPLFMPQEDCVGSGHARRRTVQDDVPEGERARVGEFPVIPGGYYEAARTTRESASGRRSYCKSQRGGQVHDVCDLP